MLKWGLKKQLQSKKVQFRFGMEGRDVIGQAQTGTGKTAAFGIPIIEKVDTKNPAVQALVIAPTRELAIQVSEEIYRIGADKRVEFFLFTVDKKSDVKSAHCAIIHKSLLEHQDVFLTILNVKL